MLQQPRVPPTGQRQAVEIQIKWREVLAQKQAMLKILSQTTGHSPEKLDKVGQAPPLMGVMQGQVWDTHACGTIQSLADVACSTAFAPGSG